ncbi:MAG: hypothetical protein AAF544_04320 [Bacteroidota bacterium]
MPKLFPFTDAKAAVDYAIQVSLIVFSILAATWVGHCNEQERDAEKLVAYLTATREEVANELERLGLNIYDAKKDLQSIQRALDLGEHDDTDSTYALVGQFLQVNMRGVFRTFAPTTWDAMIEAGDSELIRDLNVRQQIAGSFAFRNTTIRDDLNHWDAENKRVYDMLTPYIDPAGIKNMDFQMDKILKDPAGFREAAQPLMLRLLRQCHNRIFHLEVSQGQFEILQEMLEEM